MFESWVSAFLAVVRRDPDDPRTHLMRLGEMVYWWISIMAIMIALVLLGLGIHLHLNLDKKRKPDMAISAAVVGAFVQIAPFLLPSMMKGIVTWWRRRRMGVSDYFVSPREQARIAHHVFKLNMVNYFIGFGVSMAATVVWAKAPAPKLRSGQRLSLDSNCGGFLLANSTTTMNPPNGSMDYVLPNTHQLCYEANASFTMLCIFAIMQVVELFVEMLIFTLPRKVLFQ